MYRQLTFVLLAALLLPQMVFAAEPIRVGTFEVDASPPVGSPLAYDPTKGVQTPLSCRGIVLAGAGKPIVLCAVDWIGISKRGGYGAAKGRRAYPAPARRPAMRLRRRRTAQQARA